MGEAGIIELTKAINVIQNIKQKNNLKFNSRTSCQLHLGWLRNDVHTSTLKEMHNNLEILFQEILTSNGNSKLIIKNDVVHFKALNGTDDIQLVVAWLSLCMCMLHRLQQIKTQSQSTKGPLLSPNTEEQLNAFMLSETSLALKQDSKLFEYFHSRTRPISNAS
ncbi:MAG: hypothetical protein IPM97_05545 [Bdellovibrionaceae bacterium]|nr:hypothetical protein [Pseudobdellovibrionaceae bacterium]